MPIETWNKQEEAVPQMLNDSDRKDMDYLEDFFKKGLELRKPYEVAWYRNMAYFLDYQYLDYDPVRGTLRIPPAPPWRVRCTDNRIKPNALHTASKLTKSDAIYVPVPDKDDDNVVYSTRIAKKLLQHIQQNNKYKGQDFSLRLLCYLYGTAYRDLLWDFEMGDPLVSMGEEFLMTGDVRTLVRTPFEVVSEDGATNTENSLAIGTITVRSIEYVRKMYPKMAKYVQPMNTSGQSSTEKLLMTLMKRKFLPETTGDDVRYAQDEKEENRQGYVVLRQIRKKPTAAFPKGRLVTAAGPIFLGASDLPYEFMWKKRVLGIQKYDWTEIVERWYGDSPVNSQIPIQNRLNKLESCIMEIFNEMAKPKWIAPDKAELDDTSIDNESGSIVTYKYIPGMLEPHTVPGVTPNDAFFKEKDSCERSLENTSMIHETSKGLNIPGVDSKIAMEFLAEQDNTVYGPVIMRFEELDAEFYTWALMLAREKYIEPRKLQILNENHEVELFDFNNLENFPLSVKVIPGSSLPVNMMVRRNLLLEFFKAGFFGDPKLPEGVPEHIKMRLMTMVDFGDVEGMFKQMTLDQRDVRKEHQQWEKGAITPVKIWQNHAVHVPEHDNFCKTDIYARIERENPVLAQQIREHVAQHMELHPAYQQAQAAQADMQEQKNAAKAKLAAEIAEKQMTVREKMVESRLGALKAEGDPNVSKEQTVKG